ncbi:hypothetical protein BPOR_0333g00060 [Botrytis porri]|uniref:Uncharacterized protein n=1 Tax=Botrytis porri TaxID=87229 RepID=A0A4Z1KKL6_9HELO|nr:hypothetical protein BPOR_0333g00060 [Botrytis porri]
MTGLGSDAWNFVSANYEIRLCRNQMSGKIVLDAKSPCGASPAGRRLFEERDSRRVHLEIIPEYDIPNPRFQLNPEFGKTAVKDAMLSRNVKYEIGGLGAMYWKAGRSRGTAGRDLASDAMLFFVREKMRDDGGGGDAET